VPRPARAQTKFRILRRRQRAPQLHRELLCEREPAMEAPDRFLALTSLLSGAAAPRQSAA
jgi:hypothetical protein